MRPLLISESITQPVNQSIFLTAVQVLVNDSIIHFCVITAIMAVPRTPAFNQFKVGAVPGVAPYPDDDHNVHDVLEAIAAIGFSFKYPQDVDSPASLWSVLEEKRCAMTEWPNDRINLGAFYHRDEDRDERVISSHYRICSSSNQ